MDHKVRPPQYQVFINFRGNELRNSFISHLAEALQRSEINLFTDKEEKKGEDITNLFNRIEESHIALAVISERYTESRWCLDELVKIKERVDMGKLKVLPIFYNVKTDDVKQLEGKFGFNFRSLGREYKSEQPRIQRWVEAIASISGKIGLTFHNERLESEFINTIVSEVLKMLQNLASAETGNLPLKKPAKIEEPSSKKPQNTKKALKAQKGNQVINPPKDHEVVVFTRGNSSAPTSVHYSKAAPPANVLKVGVPVEQTPNHQVVQVGHGSGVTGKKSPFDGFNGFPQKYDRRETVDNGNSSSTTNNSKKHSKSSEGYSGFNGFPGY